jgi:hypothetical protein
MVEIVAAEYRNERILKRAPGEREPGARRIG